MIAPRRFLPSIRSLLALEAVARLGTAMAAAEELSLTHSAVSRQLKVLEDQLGVRMFVREGKSLVLTPAGAAYAQAVRGYLGDLARASLHLKASGSRASINLAVLPAFGTWWLTPRLPGFARRHPEVLINQTTRLAPFDFSNERFDGAIHYGGRDWPGVHYLELARERVIAACAPGFARGRPLTPERILELPLLHLDSRPAAWESWFQHHGCAGAGLRGMLFDQFATLAAATAAGLGLSLLPEFLAEREFAAGRLVPAGPDYMETPGAYFLVWPQLAEPTAAMHDFVGWLAQEAGPPPPA